MRVFLTTLVTGSLNFCLVTTIFAIFCFCLCITVLVSLRVLVSYFIYFSFLIYRFNTNRFTVFFCGSNTYYILGICFMTHLVRMTVRSA